MPAKRVSLICAAITLGLASCSSSKVEDAKRAVAYDLVDPDSAKFRDVFTNGEFVCGQVNGKNRVGAYSGYERFVATQDNDKWKIVRISSGNEGYWFETCERSASANKEASKGRNACFGSWAGQGDNKLAMMVGPDVLVDYRENERAGAWHNVIAETKLKFSNAEGVDVDMVCEGETANLSRSDQESVEALRKITVLPEIEGDRKACLGHWLVSENGKGARLSIYDDGRYEHAGTSGPPSKGRYRRVSGTNVVVPDIDGRAADVRCEEDGNAYIAGEMRTLLQPFDE